MPASLSERKFCWKNFPLKISLKDALIYFFSFLNKEKSLILIYIEGSIKDLSEQKFFLLFLCE